MADLTTITNSPVPAPARLPALEAPELSVAYLAKMKEIIEVLLGRRNGSDWDRAVTFRDLQNCGLGAFLPGGSVAQGSPAIFDPGTGTISVGGGAPVNIDAALRNSAAYKALMARIGSAEELANLPEVISSQISTALDDLARERKADIRTVENKIQTNEISMASRLTEITASLEGAAAGVREFDAAYADTMRAVAVRVEQVAAALDTAGGGVIAQELLEATADAVEGLKAQWSLKIQTVPTNGQPPVIAGIALSVEDPIAGPGTSALVFMAESFGFFTNNGTLLPFSIVGNQITFNGNVLINGTLMFGDDGKLLLAAAPPGTLNSEIAAGDFINLDPNFTSSAAWEVVTNPSGSSIEFAFVPSVSGAVAGSAVRSTANTAGNAEVWLLDRKMYPIDPKRVYEMSANLFASAGNTRVSYLAIQFFTSGGVHVGTAWGGTWSGYPWFGVPPSAGSYSTVNGKFGAGQTNTIPSNVAQCRIGVVLNYGQTGTVGAIQVAQMLTLKDVTAVDAAQAAAIAAAALDATAKSAAGSEAAAALPGINLAVAAKLNKNTDDVLGARLLLSGNGKVQLGTDSDGTTIAPAGIIGKKAGVVNYSQSTTGAVIAREFDAIGPDGVVMFSTGKTMAQQTMLNPNLVPRVSSWPVGNRYNASLFTNTNDPLPLNGEYINLPDGAGPYIGYESGAVGIPQNAWYTVSFDAFSFGTRTLIVDLYGSNIDSAGITLTLDGTVRRYSFTERMTHADAPLARLRVFAGINQSGNAFVTNVKVETGTKATAWCDNVITKENVSTFIQAAAIGLALIDRASIANLSALVAFLGNVELGIGGALFAGPATFDSGQGLRIGTDGAGDPYQVMRSASGKYFRVRPSTDTFEASGMKLISPDVEGLILPPFTASLSGGAMTSTGANGTRSLGSRQITGSGGLLPYRSFSWTVTVLEGTGATYTLISGENTDTVSVTATGTNATARARITGTIIDANGISASASFTTNASFGAV